ncbi:MAG: hypothetical protein ISS81_02100 [Candidatus Marinimicrobia bacterium]|nr:hypothetical protein [Candidatus Neomarinimicrobiota bacterium]
MSDGLLPLYYLDKIEMGLSEPLYFAQGIHASATIDGTVFYDGATQDRKSHPAFRKQIN